MASVGARVGDLEGAGDGDAVGAGDGGVGAGVGFAVRNSQLCP